MTTKFGWCMAPEGARVDHGHCPATLPRNPDITQPTGGLVMCGCECHERVSAERQRIVEACGDRGDIEIVEVTDGQA